MRISTFIAVYNAERYVASAIESVLAQTLPAHEVIVVDDGSTDGTGEVLRRFGSKIRCLSQQNSGPARALNAAMAVSAGDAFAFLDCDDLWTPEKLEIQSATLASDPNLEAVFAYAQQFVSPDLDPEIARKYVVPDRPQPGIHKNTLLIRREAFERIGRFDESLKASDFVEWYARASVLGLRWRMLKQVVTLRRQHPGNAGRRLRSKQHEEILWSLKSSLDKMRPLR